MAELLIDHDTGDVLVAKPDGAPWGRRELRPAKGQPRRFFIIQNDDPEVEAKVERGVAIHPFAEGEERSKKRVNVAALSATVKNRLADPKRSGKIGSIPLVAKGGKP